MPSTTRNGSRAREVARVLGLPELLSRVTTDLDGRSYGNLRLAVKSACSASRSIIPSLKLFLAPSLLPHRSQLPLLSRFSAVSRLELVVSWWTDPQAVADVLQQFDRQPGTVCFSGNFFSHALSDQLQMSRKGGATVIASDIIMAVPVLRIPPLSAAAPSTSLQIVTKSMPRRVVWNHLLTSICITSYTVNMNSAAVLARFEKAFLPALATLRITFTGTCPLSFADSLHLDMSQVQHLAFSGCTLSQASLEGLAEATPSLRSLDILSRRFLALPTGASQLWPHMTALSLEVAGRMPSLVATCNSFLHHPVSFPSGLEELNMRVPAGDMNLPLVATDFNTLSQLRIVRLLGVKLHMAFGPAFSSFHRLEEVKLLNLNMSSSDFSYPAQQLGLRCPTLRSLTIGGYPDTHVYAHLSSTGLLMQQYWRAVCRPGGRLWSKVPLAFRAIGEPTTIPNADRAPLVIELVRE
ncbi:hypothetical protein WJX74_009725 [Apatococcus lobatus]|uniref:Uncharacterized protein n=1 Tax=Apatococcus lobatus TaxID=904363 RepID=A0AAW1R1H1_9CHLO